MHSSSASPRGRPWDVCGEIGGLCGNFATNMNFYGGGNAGDIGL